MAPKARGELGEIRTTLATLATNGNAKSEAVVASKRDVFKKIINYMTIGIDMSSLYMQVMTCAVASAEDVVLKKMLYLFISTYAQANPDLTLLTINLLTKDCRDQDPTIRGLALRSLCQLRVANLIEYLMSPIQQGLKDAHPYVRRTAVMGVLKVYHLDSNAVLNAATLETLREMMARDGDAQVVANCMTVLQQAGRAQSFSSRGVVIPLVNRIKEFSEWAQCQVLEAVSGYQPSGEQEVYELMNTLDDRLAHSNSAVVMATVKLFLHLTITMPATHQQVLERIKEPLQTLMSRDHYETAYAVLAHFLLLAQRAPSLFSQAYTTFFCRQNEPSYIKSLKLEILVAVADAENAHAVVTELSEYVGDIDEQLAREAVRAVGRIALDVQDVEGIVERLLGFLDTGKPFVTAEAVVQVRDLMRRFPESAEACIASVSGISPEDLEEPDAKAAFVWILGHYGESIQDAPYLLERMAGEFAGERAGVRLALLTAAVRLFFKRPPECQRLLGAVLAAATADSNQDVHDRGLLYYRLLHAGMAAAAAVIAAPADALAAFAEEQSAELRNRVFDEFNSLAVIFRAPSATFVPPAPHAPLAEEPALAPVAASSAPVGGGVDEGSALLSAQEQEESLIDVSANSSPARPSGAPTAGVAAPAPPAAAGGDLLGLSDLLGGGGGGGGAAAAAAIGPGLGPPQPPPSPSLALAPAPVLAPADFQARWVAMPVAARFTHGLPPATLAAVEANAHQDFCQHAAARGIATMASGGAPPMYRFYFHAKPAGAAARILVEAIVSKPGALASVTIKADDPALGEPFAALFRTCIDTLA
ncbi:hypothetical protein WJX81_000377 [Elliptochloris bilobata]|uniref:Beta-adaptin-like protein n=1 Tax=Elliptochloris bilobata TaxID=381761 RepID=A0AAW1R014_9CHLO